MNGSAVLLVNGDDDTRIILRAAIGHFGHAVLEAEDADRAFTLLERGDVGLVICELYVTGCTDEALVTRLRRDPRSRDVKVLVASSRALPPERALAIGAGADAYFVKPLDLRKVCSTVDRLLEPASSG